MLERIDTPANQWVNRRPLISIENTGKDDFANTTRRNSSIVLKGRDTAIENSVVSDRPFSNLLSRIQFDRLLALSGTDPVSSFNDPANGTNLSADAILEQELTRVLGRKTGVDASTGDGDLVASPAIAFPPSFAPDSVKNAWNQTTRSLDVADIRSLESLFQNSIDPTTLRPISTALSETTDYGSMIDQLISGETFMASHGREEQKTQGRKMIAALHQFKEELSLQNNV